MKYCGGNNLLPTPLSFLLSGPFPSFPSSHFFAPHLDKTAQKMLSEKRRGLGLSGKLRLMHAYEEFLVFCGIILLLYSLSSSSSILSAFISHGGLSLDLSLSRI